VPTYSHNVLDVVRFYTPDGTFQSENLRFKDSVTETTFGVKRRKPLGFIPPTGYSLFYRRLNNAVGTCISVPNSANMSQGQMFVGVVGNGERFNSQDHFQVTLLENMDDPGLANASLIAARLKLKGTDINLGVAFGERKQTASLLGDTASRLARTVHALRRGETRNAMRHLGISAQRRQPRGSNWTSNWLQLQYGWKPLLSDVYGAADALSKRPKGDWRVTAKATRSQTTTGFQQWNDAGAGTCRAKATISAMTRIDALPQNEALISLASLGITNPLSIGWELVPYSFVVDWMYPVGDWLESLDALLGYTSAYASTSVLYKGEWSGRGRYMRTSPSSYIDNNYVESKRVVKLDRVASSGVPLPTLPRFKDPRSLGHMANGLALLSQAFGRSGRMR
jgi:hypothetical protein